MLKVLDVIAPSVSLITLTDLLVGGGVSGQTEKIIRAGLIVPPPSYFLKTL